MSSGGPTPTWLHPKYVTTNQMYSWFTMLLKVWLQSNVCKHESKKSLVFTNIWAKINYLCMCTQRAEPSYLIKRGKKTPLFEKSLQMSFFVRITVNIINILYRFIVFNYFSCNLKWTRPPPVSQTSYSSREEVQCITFHGELLLWKNDRK